MRATPRSALRVYALVLLSGLFLAGTFYAVGQRPLIEELGDLHLRKLDHALDHAVSEIDAIVAYHQDLVGRIANDHNLRHLHTRYDAGELTHAVLEAASRPRLETTLAANADVLGIVHRTIDGRGLTSVGASVPPLAPAVCTNAVLPGHRATRGPFVTPSGRLLYCSPIRDADDSIAGFAAVMLEGRRPQLLVDTLADGATAYILSTSNGAIAFRPQAADQDGHVAAAERYLATDPSAAPATDGSGTDGSGTGTDYRIRTHATLSAGLHLHQIVDHHRYFAPVRARSLVLGASMIAVSAFILGVTLIVLRPLIAALLNEQRLLERARYDSLTGLLNQGEMHGELAGELERARRYRRPLSLIMFDVDHFKQVNDRFGHPAGDEVLRAIGALCQSLSRNSDAWARYGGEEFLAILPETDSRAAHHLAERLRAHLETRPVHTAAGLLTVTISAGVVTWRPGASPMDRGSVDKAALIAAADRALYESKASGRNRVSVASLVDPRQVVAA